MGATVITRVVAGVGVDVDGMFAGVGAGVGVAVVGILVGVDPCVVVVGAGVAASMGAVGAGVGVTGAWLGAGPMSNPHSALAWARFVKISLLRRFHRRCHLPRTTQFGHEALHPLPIVRSHPHL